MARILRRHYLNWKDYSRFLKAARQRTRSKENYFHFEYVQGEFLIRYLEAHGVSINDKMILDIANGYGGETAAFAHRTDHIMGLDLKPIDKKLPFPQIVGDALRTPFAAGTFDLIVCASLIEHIRRPELLLEELARLTDPGSIVYISFPPFYAITGGHQFSPFHYFGERPAVRLTNFFNGLFNKRVFDEPIDDLQAFDNAFGHYGLYKFKISHFRRLLDRSKFELLDQSTKWLPLNFSKLPGLGEFMTWHVQFILRRR